MCMEDLKIAAKLRAMSATWVTSLFRWRMPSDPLRQTVVIPCLQTYARVYANINGNLQVIWESGGFAFPTTDAANYFSHTDVLRTSDLGSALADVLLIDTGGNDVAYTPYWTTLEPDIARELERKL